MFDPLEFEKFPGGRRPEVKETVAKDDSFEKVLKDVSPFDNKKQFGTANNSNQYYGESATNDAEQKGQDNEGLAYAAALINYGVDAVAREIGVEATIQGIKSFDATGSDNPIRDLYIHLGIDTEKEIKDVDEEAEANKRFKENLRSELGMPRTEKKTYEGALKAIADMKELIAEVEGADPRYNELRSAARSAGKGYFEYAVQNYGMRGLTELFTVLASQKEKSVKQKTEDTPEAKPEEETAPETQPDQNDAENKPFAFPETEQVQPNAKESPEEPKTPNAQSEQEKDPSYHLGQEKKVV